MDVGDSWMYRRSTWWYGNVIEIRKSHTHGCNRKGEKRNRSEGVSHLTPEQIEKEALEYIAANPYEGDPATII